MQEKCITVIIISDPDPSCLPVGFRSFSFFISFSFLSDLPESLTQNLNRRPLFVSDS